MEEIQVYGPFISRKQAKEQGLKQYFIGSLCIHGHAASRLVSNGSCIHCKSNQLVPNDKIKRKKQPRKARRKRISLRTSQGYGPFISRKIAKEQGLKHYFPSYTCSLGHISIRFTSTGRCLVCNREAAKAEGPKARSKNYKKYWRENNPELSSIISRNYTRIAHLIERGLLPKEGAYKSKSMGVDSNQLVAHIESQFIDGMNWENFNQIQIDHVRPINSFDLFDKEQQKVCFNYRNLQPLWAKDNRDKWDDYTPLDELAWVERMQALGYEGELFLKYEEGNCY